MAYTNNLLFNNVFLKNLSPGEEEMAAARYLVHGSARDWFRDADLSTPASIADTWIKPMLYQQSLDLVPAELEDKNAWHIVAPWDRENPLALCYIVPHGTDLDGYTPEKTLPKGQHWMIRAINLARITEGQNLRWVVLTNGERWRLLDAWSLRRYEAFLEIDLYHLLAGEDDPMAAYLFFRLLRLENSLERDEGSGKNKLDGLLEQSTKATEATERYLKTSVSDNLNTPGGGDGIMAQLCMGLVHAIDPERTKFFTEQERDAIYRDATYLLYRLLFILYAEARSLLPMERAAYRAVSLQSLIDEATELHQSPLKGAQRPTSLWNQLSALFNAIQYSDEYLGIPPYNGGLFDNKDKPYLRDYAIENKFLAEALYELAFLPDPKGKQPPERIDYRDLSVRHLGSLYEGMIEYKLFIAEEKLYARRDKDGRVQYLNAAKVERKPTDEVIEPGKVYFAQSPRERKATGTHYTAEELVERLVRQTVVRLLEERWADFAPKLETWLQEIEATPSEAARTRLRNHVDSQLEAFVREQVLSLRICDPAMGSGHFLVHIAYTITNFILQVLTATPWDNPAVNLDANTWRRLVVENCLYGVDINGMAVELAKLSLWLATMRPGKPLSFLDHHLKRGNSLLGASLQEIASVLAESDFNKQTRATKIAEAKGQYSFREIPHVMQKVEQANDLLERIAARQVETVADVEQQEEDHAAIQRLLEPYRQIGDLLTAKRMGLEIKDADVRALALALEADTIHSLSERHQALKALVQTTLVGEPAFHWQLEFSRVFLQRKNGEGKDQGSFDVMIGNPPFLGGMRISTQLGDQYLRYLKEAFPPATGTADLCSYFFRKAFVLLQIGGYFGFVATNTIAQGDTRETGLAVILRSQGRIVYAERYVKWHGDANVEVNLVAVHKHNPSDIVRAESMFLDSQPVPFISSWLDDLPEVTPKRLGQNGRKSYIGDFLQGIGFVLEPSVAEELLKKDPKNSDCIFPYLTGKEVNEDPKQRPGRYTICFHDWPLTKAREYSDLMQIVEELVKPGRMPIRRKRNRERWWLYAEYRKGLRKAISPLNRVLVRSEVSEYHMLSLFDLDRAMIFSKQLVVFALDSYYHFALLQSSLHGLWVSRYASTLESRTCYTPSDCFQTFPFPQVPSEVNQLAAEQIGQQYYQHRQLVMTQSQIGMTKTYNRYHDPGCMDAEIVSMRELHARMDRAILACYGWQDIVLEHDFYPNDRKKIRYMPSPKAQREIFIRLIALNQEIAAQEAAQGLPAEPDTPDEKESDTDEA